MKKKNLLILLIIPFLVSTLTIVSVNVTYNLVDVDISYIEFEYDDIEALQREKTLTLSAKGVNNSGYDVGKGNELTWNVKNTDGTATNQAEILQNADGGYYLQPNQFEEDGITPLEDTELIVTCRNQKGNVSNSFRLIIYELGTIVINGKTPSSLYGKIDSTNYYGEYDLVNNGKTSATFDVTVKLIPESLKDANPVLTHTDNVSVDLDFASGKSEGGGYLLNGRVSLNNASESEEKTILSSISVKTDLEEIKTGVYSFSVVAGGVNVYTYDDLLYCTNKSEKGEIAVLQTSFEDYKESYSSSEVCFGYIKNGKPTFNVSDGSLYQFETTYNHEYLNQWNATNPNNKVSTLVNVGLRVQKDFYGNGYQINLHNLTYPSDEQDGIPVPDADDIFKGPLPFYTVGSPTSGDSGGLNFNLVTAYGQDNIGFYIDGDDITINDLKVQNCNDQASLYFLDYVGTVVEVDGDNVTIKDSRMSNGKNVLRSFSSQNLTVDNCSLQNARNFLFETGANEYEKASVTRKNTFKTPTQEITSTITSFLSSDISSSLNSSIANKILDNYINGRIKENGYSGGSSDYETRAQMKETLSDIQDALTVDLSGQYKGSTELKDCLFSKSGIASVAFESLFNGPFLYSSSLPKTISVFLNLFNSGFAPENVSGTSYPVKVNVSGNTKFYDYKTLDNLDISGLVGESITTLANAFLSSSYTIDDIFPIKSILNNLAVTYSSGGEKYVNIPFAFYGGGANYSTVTFKDYEEKSHVNGSINTSTGVLDGKGVKDVDLLDNYLKLSPTQPSEGMMNYLKQLFKDQDFDADEFGVDGNTLIKTVTLVTGYEPFKFVFNKNDGYLFNEDIQIEEMQLRAITSNGATEA